MRPVFKLSKCLLFLMLGLEFSGCSTLRQGKETRSLNIEFKGTAGAVTETRYFSNAFIKTYSDRQITRDRREAVDFSVRSEVQSYDPQTKLLKFKVTTLRKDGPVSLHDLAFPELHEEIDYVVQGDGEVKKAGAYSPQSLFFVPSFPVPKGAVEVGDTWTMAHTWLSARDGIPLQLNVVGILKGIVPCENGRRTCADVEVSGHVKLLHAPTAVGAAFVSRLWGRMLFSPDRGDVIWSEMRSQEEMEIQGEKISILSCIVSESKLSATYQTKFECEPNAYKVPGSK